jgi:hypothetical protein
MSRGGSGNKSNIERRFPDGSPVSMDRWSHFSLLHCIIDYLDKDMDLKYVTILRMH